MLTSAAALGFPMSTISASLSSSAAAGTTGTTNVPDGDTFGFPASDERLDVDAVGPDERVPQARAASDLAPATFRFDGSDDAINYSISDGGLEC